MRQEYDVDFVRRDFLRRQIRHQFAANAAHVLERAGAVAGVYKNRLALRTDKVATDLQAHMVAGEGIRVHFAVRLPSVFGNAGPKLGYGCGEGYVHIGQRDDLGVADGEV